MRQIRSAMHVRIIDAIAGGDAAEARRLMHEHIHGAVEVDETNSR